ncbi:hypothetical protein WN66_05868 [Saccharomyces cerevisiae]|uniref:Putative uncharacterized protein YOR041C n=1 Tax=Saccharomyces cerevisiae (strain ATCC 204508 / S288c) TaxID=559292 RepID=YO041_YEAST|nr:RecName: Full=Putative uncharacterized protein YOR041C [Saccharomyces cerevisiae S288C]KZV07928.1 hypothetical protein WN66_05868 [Saccharomyces cerevisiae]CAA99231.1 unnamed protein product [Saccharomyces cerevisiae]
MITALMYFSSKLGKASFNSCNIGFSLDGSSSDFLLAGKGGCSSSSSFASSAGVTTSSSSIPEDLFTFSSTLGVPSLAEVSLSFFPSEFRSTSVVFEISSLIDSGTLLFSRREESLIPSFSSMILIWQYRFAGGGYLTSLKLFI